MTRQTEQRVYISTGLANPSMGIITPSIQKQADEYSHLLRNDTTEWEGVYEIELPTVKQNTGNVIMRIQNGEKQFGYNSPDGFQRAIFDNQNINSSAIFGSMLVNYAVEEYPEEFTPEKVANFLHNEDVDKWWNVVSQKE